MKNWFSRLGQKANPLNLGKRLKSLWTKDAPLEERLNRLEELLLEGNFGLEFADFFIKSLSKKDVKNLSPEELHHLLVEKIVDFLKPFMGSLPAVFKRKPAVITLVGVNGSGKTTTAGKMAAFYQKQGLQVALAGADLFRAAADQQTHEWAKRAGVRYVSPANHKDSSGFVFDALQEAKALGDDLLLIDTAGRLHNQSNLMAELEKMHRVLKKQDPLAPDACFLVLDGTVGQNAQQQLALFAKHVPLTGLILTKLDGTSRPGFVAKLFSEHKLPLMALGLGETLESLVRPDAERLGAFLAGEQEALAP